jgi:hypothetical protein
MNWEAIRHQYPNNWVVVEAIDAATQGTQRIIDELNFIQAFGSDWNAAWALYKQVHRADKNREYYVLHADRQELNIGIIETFGRVLG